MSSTSSWSPAAVEKAVTVSQEALEEAYVRLNTQLLLCLQRRDTDAALRTAEAIRDMLSSSPTVHQSNSAGGGGGSDSLPSSSAPFHGSPAEQLLQLREQLRTLASTESRRAHNNGSGEATTPDSTSSESGSDNEDDDDDDDDDDDEEETSESEQYSDSVDDKDDDKGREKEGAMVSSSGSNPSRQHQQQQAASHRIAEALIKLRHAFPETASDCPTQDSSALCGAAAAASSSSSSSVPKKTTTTRPSQPFELQPRPPPPRHRVDGGNTKKACSHKTGDDSAKRCVLCLQEPPREGEGIEQDAGDRSQDAEADAVLWERMRAEVAEEMKRLAVVRKNR
ncbi:hypothetical protein JKF63_06125 [Porcisia hertigi]|uniref:Uncharacterized protein n=1 Tax=Porcisia hertigi TaxID=2761500 RepID=A0A836ID27_9TRYP|nr:hypothetical protein JKF63_06125 [Porcisia hertigi]